MTISRKANVAFILVVLFLDVLGIGLIIPVLPRLIEALAPGELGHTSRNYGLFIAVYPAMQFVCAPIIGALSDRFGRRSVILISLAGAVLDYVLQAFAPTLAWLFVGRVIAGITGANFAAATAYIADVTPADQRAKAFGLIGATFGIGFILGPGIGGLLGSHYLRAPFMFAAALSFINLIYGAVVLPESLSPEHRRAFSLRRASPMGALMNLGRYALVRGLLVTIVCGYLAQQILQSVWALHTAARFAWRPSDIGLSLVAVGVVTAAVQGGLVRAAIPRIGERGAIVLGLMFSVTGYASFAVATRGWMFYALMIPFSLGGFVEPAIKALLSREVGASEQGALQGSLASLASVAAVVGPVLGTHLFAHFAPSTASPHIPGAAFFAAAGLNATGLMLAARLFATRKPRPSPTSQASRQP